MGAGLVVACKSQSLTCCEPIEATGEPAFDQIGFSTCPDGSEKEADGQDQRILRMENDPAMPMMASTSGQSSSSQRRRSVSGLALAVPVLTSQADLMSPSGSARMRFRGAVKAVTAAKRFEKSVRFRPEGSVAEVVLFEVVGMASERVKGFKIGDKVCWTDRDDDVPKGSVGVVSSCGDKDTVQVRFPKGTWDFKASELFTNENWAGNLVRTALEEAEELMRDKKVLEAEATVVEALEKLQEVTSDKDDDETHSEASGHEATSPGGRPGRAGLVGMRSPGQRRALLLSASETAEAVAAIKHCGQASLYREILQRTRQYEALGQALMPDGFRLAFEGGGTQIWVRTLPGSKSWYEYKLVCDLGDAGLPHCLAYSHELDLRDRYEPRLLQKPEHLGPVHPLLCVTHTLMSVFAVRVELVLEVFRWFNHEYGFYGESVRSHKPARVKGAKPDKERRNCRPVVDSQSLWIPKGNGQQGTVVVTLMRLRAEGRLGKWILSTFIKRVATAHAADIRAHVQHAQDPNGPYVERLRADKTGFYEELGKVEEAAARRTAPPLSIDRLPSPYILRRPKKLPQPEDLPHSPTRASLLK